MLLMDIITWEPKDSLKVAEFYANYDYPKGIKVIEEWTDLTGYRTFIIYETEDEKHMQHPFFHLQGCANSKRFRL